MSADPLKNLPAMSVGGAVPAPAKETPLGAPIDDGRFSKPQFTTPQKAALVIAALGPQAAGPIFERIADKHLRAFTRAFAHLQTVPQDQLKRVVEEFVGEITREDNNVKGGYEETRELLSQFKSSDEIFRLMDDINLPGGESVWEKLDRAKDEQIAEYLGKQNAQVAAVILSKLNPEKASNLINLLEQDMASEVVIRLSKPLSPSRVALDVLMKTIEREFLAPMRSSSKARNPGEMIGTMMNNIMSEKRDKLLEVIGERAPEILRDVKKSMLTFQDIAERVPPQAIPIAIREVEDADFLHAIKFGRQNAPSSAEFIFANISQRMASQYEEQIAELPDLPVKEAEAAQAAFMSVIRRLAKSGEITLLEIKTEDDQE